MTAPGTDASEALEACRAFVAAVAWGEHHRVWEILGPEGRKTVLRVATGRGMDEPLAMRLRQERPTPEEREEFLTDLVNGLRADFAGTDLDTLEYELDPEAPAPGRARVLLRSPLPEPLASHGGLPAGSVELARDESDRWRVERLVPRPGR
jgi:hypothetical protein